MADLYANMGADLGTPAIHCYAITPSDTTDLPFVTKAIWFGGPAAGDITLTLSGDAGTPGVLFQNVEPGSMLPFRVQRVWATGTTAGSNLVALY